MKKFMSMLMLVVLTITLSACDKKESTLAANFTFETTIPENIEEKANRGSITGNLTATNNTNYYITNYPIVVFPVDETGNPLGEAFKSTNITMAPNATVVYPFDIYFSDIESVPYDIKVLPVDWEIGQSIVNKKNKDSEEYNKNHTNPADKEHIIPPVDIDEEHFRQRLKEAVTKNPKNLVYYGINPATTECKYVKSEENNNYYSLQFNVVNKEDYDICLKNVTGLLTYKQGDEIVKQTWITESFMNTLVYLKPGEETIVADRYGYGLKQDEGYTMEFTLLPALEGITK